MDNILVENFNKIIGNKSHYYFFLTFIKNKDFLINLFDSLNKSIKNYYDVKDFNYIFIIPELFKKKYNIQKLNLDALTIIKLYNISTNHKYILPLPTDFI